MQRKQKKSSATQVRSRTHVLMEAVESVIADERGTLMRVESLLRCMQIAHEYQNEDDPRGPYYPEVIAITCELVSTVLNNLDSPVFGQRLDAIEERSTAPTA